MYEKICKAIEDKLKDNDLTIYLRESEIARLKEQLAEAEKTIASQSEIIASQEKTIDDLKGIDR